MVGHQTLTYAREVGSDRGGRLVGRVEIRDRLLAKRYTVYPPDLGHSARADTKSRD